MSSPKKTIVILGASPNPDRVSNMLLRRLAGHSGYDVIPVNPAQNEIEGVAVKPGLDAVEPGPELLTMYVGAERSDALGDAIVRLNPGKVIFNPGAENADLASRLHAHGIDTENACSLVLLGQGRL